jgi:hypothetical protein
LVLQYLGFSGIRRSHFGCCTRLSPNYKILLFGDAMFLLRHFAPTGEAPLPRRRCTRLRRCVEADFLVVIFDVLC